MLVTTVVLEWVGRNELLQALNSNLQDLGCRIVGLIGFGGEGKSSIARRWLDTIPEAIKPDGVFWWNFYEISDIDTFFEATLTYLCGRKNLKEELKIWRKEEHASVIAAMLEARHYLFVLDGLEVMQYEKGDLYGQFKDARLRQLLGHFASPNHLSFCLITSRAPLLDLIDYATYIQHDVEHLTLTEGCTLLRNIGVVGTDSALEQVITKWSGYALALSLIGSYLVEQYGGDTTYTDGFSISTGESLSLDRIRSILQRYDKHLSQPERALLILYSVFRLSPGENHLNMIRKQPDILDNSLSTLSDTDFTAILNRLTAYRLLRYDSKTNQYTTHAFILDYYRACFDLLSKKQLLIQHHISTNTIL